MRKTGFTLVEVLVSVLIAVVLLGASVQASRQVLQSTQLAQQQTQMNGITQNLLSQVEILEDANPAFFQGLNLTTTSPSVYGTLFNQSSTHGTVSLSWETFTTDSGYTYGFTNPACYSGNSCTISQYQPTINLKNGMPVTSLLAASRNPSQTSGFSELDPTNLNGTISISTTSVNAKYWDFYQVSMKISLYVVSGSSSESFDLDDVNDTGSTNPPLTSVDLTTLGVLQGRTYQVTVSVQNYADPTQQATRTIVLSDWQHTS